MIGGYVQLAYGFNYYGTVGSNRDEFVILRKMDKVDWMDQPLASRRPRAMTSRATRNRPRHAQETSMKIRAQIAMVMNLDKCIGCHTCSVTCKNVWTSRSGTEYAWWNNVETKPGIGYPKDWENQERWKGGWERKAGGGIGLKQGSKLGVLLKIFANPHLPEIDDYYEPFTFDYDFVQSAPEMQTSPVARPISILTQKRMEKIEWGPNWEEILGGEFSKRSKDHNFADIEKEIYGEFENTFMIHLPRICEHCLNPACVASCPSGSIYKREEDGIVLIDQDKCRGWRMCVSGCPYKKIYYNWATGKAEKCIFCYPRIEAGQPTVCSETCVGRIRYLGVMLYDADGIAQAASVENPQDLYQAQLDIFLDPDDPAVQAQARADGVPEKWLEAARRSPATRWRSTGRSRFRCTPNTGRCRWCGTCRRCRRSTPASSSGKLGEVDGLPGRPQPAHPGALPRQPADRRQGGAGGARARTLAGDARVFPRAAARRRRQRRDARAQSA